MLYFNVLTFHDYSQLSLQYLDGSRAFAVLLELPTHSFPGLRAPLIIYDPADPQAHLYGKPHCLFARDPL